MTSSQPLPRTPNLDPEVRRLLEQDFERYRTRPLPRTFTEAVRERYGVNLTTRYGGFVIKNPFGKASGQLSLQASQIEMDAKAQLAFVVLKTVIAQDTHGNQSMGAWAIPETKMVVERIRGKDGTEGWTVTWKGRGWYGSLEDYLVLFKKSLQLGRDAGMLTIPSCKYHLPEPGVKEWHIAEYEYSTRRLLEAWQWVMGDVPMPLEKDFSPTLAGDHRSREKEQILEWLRRVPTLIREAGGKNASGQWRVRVGLKLMNAMFEDEFQVEMIRAAVEGLGAGTGTDWLVYANRLFDPRRAFEGKMGIAYGGPDLSARNLRVLRMAHTASRQGRLPPLPPISATGNILSGRTAIEYALVGAENFQMHTLFQLPHTEFPATSGSRTSRALHRLLFDPNDGYLAWMAHLRRLGGSGRLFSLEDLHASLQSEPGVPTE